MCVLVCKTEAVRQIVSELVWRDWLLQSSACSGTAVSVRRTEVLPWTRAEWAEAAAGSSRFRHPRRHSQRCQFRSASSSALPGGLAPAPAGSPAAGPSPERRASSATCYQQKTQETRGSVLGFESLTWASISSVFSLIRDKPEKSIAPGNAHQTSKLLSSIFLLWISRLLWSTVKYMPKYWMDYQQTPFMFHLESLSAPNSLILHIKIFFLELQFWLNLIKPTQSLISCLTWCHLIKRWLKTKFKNEINLLVWRKKKTTRRLSVLHYPLLA